MVKDISDFKVFVDGVLDVDASADKFREHLVESELTNATLREEITLAINSVLSEAKGAIPCPALLGLVRGVLGRAQDVNTYNADGEMVKEVLKSSVYTVNRGPGGGVWLNIVTGKQIGRAHV